LDTESELGLLCRHIAAHQRLLEVSIPISSQSIQSPEIPPEKQRFQWWPTILTIALPLIFPLFAYAQVGGSPFDTGFTALQNLFTGTVAKVAKQSVPRVEVV